MTEHKDLIVWQKSMSFIVVVYRLIEKLPGSEKYGLADQLRRASVSIASNIAEGSKRSSEKDFKSFLHNSLGPLAEVETQLLTCKNLGFLTENDLEKVFPYIEEISKMLTAFIKRLS